MKQNEHAKYVARVRKKKLGAPTETRVEVLGTVADRMRDELVPLFKEPWDARHAVCDFLTGRRIGKSESLCRLAFRGAWENPKSVNPLILPTAKQARLALWPLLLRVREKHFKEAKINDTEMRIYLPEGGAIVCGGCEHEEDVAKWFGIPFQEAIIDECGNFKPHLAKLYNDSIKPGTMDFRASGGGRVTRSGNPGLICTGPWWDWTNDDRKVTTPLYKGDARMNPYIQDVMSFFLEVLEENGWFWDQETNEASPTFARLYLGQWVRDLGVLVYPYKAYHEGKPFNYASELPTRSETGDIIDAFSWRYVLGMDIGFVHETTWVVIATHPGLREQFLVYAEGHSEWLDDQKIERTHQLLARYPKMQTVIDPGGGGKNVIETLIKGKAGRQPISAKVADKQAKAAAIRDLRDWILAGFFKVLPAGQPWVDEVSILGWDEQRLQHDPNGTDHFADAALYAYRESKHYRYNPTIGRRAPAVGTDEYYQWKHQKLLEEFAKRDGSGEQGMRSRHARRGRRRYGALLQ
jgi:hypothetical protein